MRYTIRRKKGAAAPRRRHIGDRRLPHMYLERRRNEVPHGWPASGGGPVRLPLGHLGHWMGVSRSRIYKAGISTADRYRCALLRPGSSLASIVGRSFSRRYRRMVCAGRRRISHPLCVRNIDHRMRRREAAASFWVYGAARTVFNIRAKRRIPPPQRPSARKCGPPSHYTKTSSVARNAP